MKVYQLIRHDENGNGTPTDLFSTLEEALSARDHAKNIEHFKDVTWDVVARELDSYDFDEFKRFLDWEDAL